MPLFDHIGITVDDLPRAIAQFDPVMQALGCTRQDADNGVSWYLGEEELILFPTREPGTGPHRHGQVGWQHLAFPVASRAEVDRFQQQDPLYGAGVWDNAHRGSLLQARRQSEQAGLADLGFRRAGGRSTCAADEPGGYKFAARAFTSTAAVAT